AGSDSSLLQISGEERQRVARVAELFTEEDLARHLQIMLRTHAELGYRPEQRFHLELGLLKMSHAQRLLPLEQLLSEVAGGSDTRRIGKSIPVPETRKPEVPPSIATIVSPFSTDSARKTGSKTELSSESNPGNSRIVAGTNAPVVMGSAALAAVAQPAPETSPQVDSQAEPQLSDMRIAVL